MNRLILRLLAQRIALALLSLLAVSVVVFAITAVLPGDAAQEQLGQEDHARVTGSVAREDGARRTGAAALRALARGVGDRQRSACRRPRSCR